MLRLSAALLLTAGAASSSVAAGAVLALTGGQSGSLTGGVTLDTDFSIGNSSTLTVTGGLTLAAGRTITLGSVNNTTTLSIAGALSGGGTILFGGTNQFNTLSGSSLTIGSGITVRGEVSHNSAATLRANVTPRLTGNFFTVDLGATRAAFEAVPWVRQAVVRREVPNRLKVILQEHQAVAYWVAEGDSRLLNSFGEVFEANPGEVEHELLPRLVGPAGQDRLEVRDVRGDRLHVPAREVGRA